RVGLRRVERRAGDVWRHVVGGRSLRRLVPAVAAGAFHQPAVCATEACPMIETRYFEDLQIGQKFSSAPRVIDEAAIKTFAAEFDPQPFHLDEDQARHSPFAGLAASGWHTAALTMRLCLASDFRPAGGILGTGGELIWSKPVRPGDALHVEIEIIEARPSRSQPSWSKRWSAAGWRSATSTICALIADWAPALTADRPAGSA